MKKSFKASWLAFFAAALLSSTVSADGVKCRKIDGDNLREECYERKVDNKLDDDDGIFEDDDKIISVKCKNIDNDKLRRECMEEKYD